MITNLEPLDYPWDLLLLADPSRQLIQHYIKDALVLGWKDADLLMGVVVVAPIASNSWEIKNLAVSPASQGKGLGTALLLAAIDTCRTRGAREIWIGTGNSSIGQLRLYQKIGFRMREIDFDFFVRNYDEEIVENGIRCRDMIRLVYTIETSVDT